MCTRQYIRHPIGSGPAQRGPGRGGAPLPRTLGRGPRTVNRRDPAARLAATGPRALLKHTPSHLNTAILVYPLSNLYLPNPSISYVSSIPHSHPLAHVAAAHVLSSILATTGLARKDSAMWTGNAPGMAESHGIYAKY